MIPKNVLSAQPPSGDCMSCYGSGEVATDAGPTACPDCAGTGSLPGPMVLTERRLREIEGLELGNETPAGEVRWLVFEVRRMRDVLLQILSASQDGNDDDPLIRKIRFAANEGLGLYASRPVDS